MRMGNRAGVLPRMNDVADYLIHAQAVPDLRRRPAEDAVDPHPRNTVFGGGDLLLGDVTGALPVALLVPEGE